jgi:Zn-dependent protease
MLFQLLFSSPLEFLSIALALILALSFHEAAHAFVADRLGDSTARLMGRLSLNPVVHIDLIGAFMLLFLGFGWGKPVMVNPHNFRNPIRDELFVALAGPLSNLFLTLMAAIIYFLTKSFASPPLQSLLLMIGFYNLILMFFNLIPIPPLDGSKVLALFLSAETMETINRYGIFILLIVIFIPINGVNIVNLIIFNPASKIIQSLFGQSLFF